MSGAALCCATLGGLTAWAAHLVLSYLAIAILCGGELRGATRPDATVVLVALTAAALAAALHAAVLAYGGWTRGSGWVPPVAFGGFLLDLLAVVAILAAGIVPGYIRAC